MAGRGPAPKLPSQRRNRTAPARGEWVDLEPLDKPVLPELPALADEEWNPNTAALWDAWRSDPVTAMWSVADVAFALDTIMLHQTMTPSVAGELRRRMDSLGLTPKGKRDLRWRLPEEGADVVELGKGRKRMPQARRLRAV